MEASQAAQRIARALEEGRDDVANTLNSYVDHPANDRKRARIAQQLADHDAAIADLRALLAERDELAKDAARYRHLTDVHGPRTELCFDGEVCAGKAEFDAMIDASIARAALTKEAP